MYKYFFYGIGVVSEVKIYHLEQYTGDRVDVKIHYGQADDDIKEYLQKGINSTMSKTRVWFTNDVGIFVIKNGNEVLIEPKEGASEDDVASFVLGWCIAFLFQQREIPAIHCSALEMKGGAVLIAGNSGAGKSTIALGLQQRGYRYLVDDIAMVDIQGGMCIQPAFPMQKVCRNVAETMDSNTLYYVNEKKDKFAYRNQDNFCSESRKLAAMFYLNKHSGEAVVCERLTGVKKWNTVAQNLFLRDAYTSLGMPKEELDRCLAIAGSVEIYEISRPEGKDTVEEICEKMIELVEGRTEA